MLDGLAAGLDGRGGIGVGRLTCVIIIDERERSFWVFEFWGSDHLDSPSHFCGQASDGQPSSWSPW